MQKRGDNVTFATLKSKSIEFQMNILGTTARRALEFYLRWLSLSQAATPSSKVLNWVRLKPAGSKR